MACVVCKQLTEVCALNPSVKRFQGDQLYLLRWTRFNGYLLTNSGKLHSWGKPTSARGRIKIPSGKKDSEPLPIPIFTKIIIVEMCCGNDHVLALEAQLFVWTWGYNAKGQLGVAELEEESGVSTEDAEKMMQRRPERLNKLNEICHIYAARDMSFAIGVKGKVFAWGDNTHHQFSLPDIIVRQPTLIPELPWYDSAKRPILLSGLEEDKNEALELVMARLDISEMKLLKEDNRDLKRRLTNHVKKLTETETTVFLDESDSYLKQPFETTAQINASIGKLITESTAKMAQIQTDIQSQKDQLSALVRKIEGILEQAGTLSAEITESEPELESLRNAVSVLQEQLKLQRAKEDAGGAEEEEGESHPTTTHADPVEEIDIKLQDTQRQLNDLYARYENTIQKKAELYAELGVHQLNHAEQLKAIEVSKSEKDRLEKLIEVYKTTNELTENKLSDDYFESHKKVITGNLNFLARTQAILNETLIMELSKVVPISSILDLMDVSRNIMSSMNDEIRIGIRKFSSPAMRKLNLLWRIVGMNYALMGFVQDALEELVRAIHHEVITEDKYQMNPYWSMKRQPKAVQTPMPFTTRTKEETSRSHRECCF